MKKTGKVIISIVYGIGAAIALTLLALVLSRAQGTPNPDAMLPMELHEAAGLLLAIGFPPMLAASILFHIAHDIFHSAHKTRTIILLYLPAAVCLAFFLFWAGVWGIGMVNMVFRLGL